MTILQVDKEGITHLDIAGKWNSQLVARKAGAGLPELSVDVSNGGSSEAPYTLLWKNTVKPTAPFNLSPFALTLNVSQILIIAETNSHR